MIYNFDGFNYLIRLDKGDRLHKALERFVQETKLEGAWVSGVGAAQEATLGFYDVGKKAYRLKQFDGVREIVSLSGNLASDEDGKLIIHLHGVLGDAQYRTVGGHIKDLVAGATVELFVHRAYRPTKRKHDETTGLKVLDL
jgi:uncharacterized protein